MKCLKLYLDVIILLPSRMEFEKKIFLVFFKIRMICFTN